MHIICSIGVAQNVKMAFYGHYDHRAPSCHVHVLMTDDARDDANETTGGDDDV